MSEKLDITKSVEVSLKENIYDFLVDYNVVDKFDTLNIHKYLMFKNNIMFVFIKNVFCIVKQLHRKNFWWIISL